MMTKTKFLLLLGIFSFDFMYSQIGIYTDYPRTLFHVDGARDNPLDFTSTLSSAQVANDVVITKDGNMGIGTILPQVKLDVMGKIRYDDGNIGSVVGKILKSDANGVARWESTAKVFVGEWVISNSSALSFSDNTEVSLIGTSNILIQDIGLSIADGTNCVIIGAGRYLISVHCDLDVNENGWLRIRNGTNNSELCSFYYSANLLGATFLAFFEENTPIKLSFQSVNDGFSWFKSGNFAATYSAKLVFLKI